MENVITAQSTFSVFGNVSELISKVEGIKELFKDFKHDENTTTLPNGLPTTNHIFTKENMAVVVRTYRIDIQYGYNTEKGDTTDNFLEFVNSVVEKLNQLANPLFNRVAYTDANFIKKDDENMKKFNELFSVANVFGENGSELQIRVNNVKEVNGELTNCVSVAQDGSAENKHNHERMSVIFVNNDINTLAQAREPRFTWDKSKELLADFIMVAKERTNKILSNL